MSLDKDLKDQYDRHRRIEEGRDATLIEGVVKPYFNKVKDETVQWLIIAYRNGTLSHDILIGKVAELSALDRVISNLRSAQSQGSIAADREYNHA